ncbi:putative membrane protein [Mangrovibacterium marinum]|uniref:Putative membrane protein n=2 Tax=Mangrovibacterium marinum TaxID=1639118 RepID=A0A2T5BZ10_9BACT|nr:putative membrane protein [Mangrovibacterium marinum]
MLFIWQGSVLPKIMPRLVMLTAFSIVIYLFHGSFFSYKITLNPSAFTLLGVALAIFLGFCNTAAYDRYWEGRKLWGALVIDTRSFTRQILTYLPGNDSGKTASTKAVYLTIAYTYALKHQLRDTDAMPDLQRLLSADECRQLEAIRFKPVMLLKMLGHLIAQAGQNGHIDSITKMGIDRNIDRLSATVGGCERIANTPIPFPYHVLIHRTVYIYCLLLPFGLVDTIGWMTPIMVSFIGYTFMALDAIVHEIADPFGTEPNDLALNSLCKTVEHSLLEMAGLPMPKAEMRNANFCID